MPSASQLGVLRMMARASDRAQRLIRLSAARNRREKWSNQALTVLEELFRSDGVALWDMLEAEDWPVLTDGGRRRLRDELRDEALVVLLDEAARRQAREDGS